MATTTQKITVRGQREVEMSLARYERGIRKTITAAGYVATKIVSADARARFSGYASVNSSDGNLRSHSRSAVGFVPQVRGPVAKVRQRRSKTTGRHPEYGALQMRRGLVPALTANRDKAVAVYEAQLEIHRIRSGL